MSNVVPFQNMQAPAFLAQVNLTPDQVRAMNAAAAVGTGGGGLNKISLKQSRFRMVVGGQEQIIPSLSIDMVLVRVNDGINKTWYEKDWNPNEDAGMPDCSSDDGITPRADSPKRQCDTCAACPRNQWGSKINQVTGAKGKQCQDTKRMAILPPGPDGRYASSDSLFQLAVPPASLGDFGGFVRNLAAMPTPAAYNMVVCEVSFDPQVTYPKILFRPKRWLDNDEWEHVSKLYDDQETKRVAGLAEAQTMQLTNANNVAPQAQPQMQQQAQQPVQQAQQNWNQPQQQVQQPVQQQAQQNWNQPQQQVQQPVQQQAQQNWGQPQQAAQQPVQQQAQQNWNQPQQAQPQQNWNQPQQMAQQPVQQPVQQAQQPVQQAQQPVQQAQQPVQRERGKPAPGRSRRTKEEMEEDRLADERDAMMAQQNAQTQQPVQQQAQQPQQSWGQPQPVAQQPMQQQPQQMQVDPNNPWAGAGQQPQQTGAPIQPNVMGGDVASAFQGWDDPQ